MVPLEKDDEIKNAYSRGLTLFVSAIERGEESGKLNDPDWFASTLKYGIKNFGLDANQLAEDESISRGAISKWINEKATPPAPTRKTVIHWALKKAREQLTALQDHQQMQDEPA